MNRRSSSLFSAAVAFTFVFVTASSLASRSFAQEPTSVLDGVFTPDQASRGKLEFQQTCATCHSVTEHTGRNFESAWQGNTIGELFDLVSNTMPESDPGGLKPEEYASILAYFLSESGYKPGEKELPADLDALKKIRIEPLPK